MHEDGGLIILTCHLGWHQKAGFVSIQKSLVSTVSVSVSVSVSVLYRYRIAIEYLSNVHSRTNSPFTYLLPMPN